MRVEMGTPSLELQALPQDLAACHQLIRSQAEIIEGMKRQMEQLYHGYHQLRRHVFGAKSERVEEGQEIFAFYGTLEPKKPEGDEPAGETAPQARRKGHGRRVLPPELPRETTVHDVPEQEKFCPKCRERMQELPPEVTERLEYQPASFYVIQDVRKKYACHPCESTVAVAEAPLQPIAKGLAGPGLLAQVLICKYCDHVPLYRQSLIYGRHGLDLARSTLCGWVLGLMGLLRPLILVIRKDVLLSKVVQTDDTPVKLWVPGNGKCKQAHLWGYMGDREHRQVVFEFTTTHEQRHAQEFLRDYAGYLQADAWPGYNVVFQDGRIIEVGCMAHNRRGYFEAKETDPERARIMIEMIRRLYEIEDRAKDLSAQDRREMRQEQARPILEGKMKPWIEEEMLKVLPKSPIGEAMKYSHNHWDALCRYLEDGDLNIDNNAMERALRGACVGKKNYLFMGSEAGGEAAAMAYTLIESAKLSGLEPWAYLRDVIARIAAHPMSRLDELMPRKWKPPPDST